MMEKKKNQPNGNFGYQPNGLNNRGYQPNGNSGTNNSQQARRGEFNPTPPSGGSSIQDK